MAKVTASLSFLTQRPFRAAPCQFLLNVTPANRTAAVAAFKKAGQLGGKYSGLRISGIQDVSFLKDFPLLLYLEIVDVKRFNPRQLDCLENLRGLRLESPGGGLDFACFPLLEVFVGDWHADNQNLTMARELRRLKVWHFNPQSRDLTVLKNMVRLENLGICQTNIASLSGIATLEDLRFLDIAYAPRLKSLGALAASNLEIREFDVTKAPKLDSYRPIASLARLRRLRVSSCASMQNLKWITGMKYLDFFSFVETNVVDGDLSPLLKLPLLRYVGTLNRKHYNYKCDALNELLSQRGPGAWVRG